MTDTVNQTSDAQPASIDEKRRCFRIHGTYALGLWAPGLYLLMWASFAAAWVSLGRRPYPSRDDPKWIEGFWMWVYDFSWLWFIWGVPVALALAIVSLLMTPRAPGWFGRLRLPEWGLGLLILIYFAWQQVMILSYAFMVEDSTTMDGWSPWYGALMEWTWYTLEGLAEQVGGEYFDWDFWLMGLVIRALGAAMCLSVIYLLFRLVMRLTGRAPKLPTQRSQRLLELSVSFICVAIGWSIIGLDMNANPYWIAEWWWD